MISKKLYLDGVVNKPTNMNGGHRPHSKPTPATIPILPSMGKILMVPLCSVDENSWSIVLVSSVQLDT